MPPKLLSLQSAHAIVMDLHSITLSSLRQTKRSNAKLQQDHKHSQNPQADKEMQQSNCKQCWQNIVIETVRYYIIATTLVASELQ